MKCQQIQDLLSEYVDGDLAPDAASRVRLHLEQCGGCEELASDLSAMRDAATGLALELDGVAAPAPSAGWDVLAQKLRRQRQAAPESHRRVWPYLALAAVAAGLLLALGLTVLRPADDLELARQQAMAELSLLHRQQQRAIRALGLVVGKQRSHWTPKMRQLFARNAGVVDAALEECRRAVDKEPTDRELQASLAAAYQRKVEFLRIFSGLEENP